MRKIEEKRLILSEISEFKVVRKCQQNVKKSPSADRWKFEKNRFEKTLNASRSASQPLRVNPKTVLNSCDEGDQDYALMLVLVKCYDNKMVKATHHLFHPFLDSALGS